MTPRQLAVLDDLANWNFSKEDLKKQARKLRDDVIKSVKPKKRSK